MKEYKKKLMIQHKIMIVMSILSAALFALSIAAELELLPFFTPVSGDSSWESTWHGILCGMSFAFMAISFASVIRLGRALKDEKELKELYIKCNDERAKQIETESRSTTMMIFAFLSGAAIIVAGYFSKTVSYTIVGCLAVMAIIKVICRIIYSKIF